MSIWKDSNTKNLEKSFIFILKRSHFCSLISIHSFLCKLKNTRRKIHFNRKNKPNIIIRNTLLTFLGYLWGVFIILKKSCIVFILQKRRVLQCINNNHFYTFTQWPASTEARLFTHFSQTNIKKSLTWVSGNCS